MHAELMHTIEKYDQKCNFFLLSYVSSRYIKLWLGTKNYGKNHIMYQKGK